METVVDGEAHVRWIRSKGLRYDGRHARQQLRRANVMLRKGPGRDCAHPTGVLASTSLVNAGNTRVLVTATAELAAEKLPRPFRVRVCLPPTVGGRKAEEALNLAADTESLLLSALPDALTAAEDDGTGRGAYWALLLTVVFVALDGTALDWALLACGTALKSMRLPALVWDTELSWWRVDDTRVGSECVVHDDDLPVAASAMQLGSEDVWLFDPCSREEKSLVCRVVAVQWRKGQSPVLLCETGGQGLDEQMQKNFLAAAERPLEELRNYLVTAVEDRQ